jgi:protein-tyrosine phosphatase
VIMQIQIYWIDYGGPGRLGIMPRPRGGDWLEDEVSSLLAENVEVLVSLLEEAEVTELSLGDEQRLAESGGILYVSYPIADRGVPTSLSDTRRFVQVLEDHLKNGRNVVIHCRQGVGRSAMIAACLLASAGMSAELAFEMIARARGCAVPDTKEQRQFADNAPTLRQGMSPFQRTQDLRDRSEARTQSSSWNDCRARR